MRELNLLEGNHPAVSIGCHDIVDQEEAGHVAVSAAGVSVLHYNNMSIEGLDSTVS